MRRERTAKCSSTNSNPLPYRGSPSVAPWYRWSDGTADTWMSRMNDEWLKIIGKDPYVAEAANVLSDWIVADKKNTVGKQ